MYTIYADDTLIYDSTLEDYKIGKGSISLEVDKSGSFTFSIYPDHFFYESFVKLKTVITVYKSGRIVFRGRILNDVTDYWNNKVITCEGELGFLRDSLIRPFSFTGSPEALFKQFIEEHNSQVDEFKRFEIGTVTVVDNNEYVNRSSTGYADTLSTLTGATTGSELGGHIFITHGDDGTDPIPTIHYLADFTHVATQNIEFGSNLKNYTKTVKAEDIATAIIPLGATTSTDNERLTIKDVNGGVDYIYSESGVALYGWIFKTIAWEDVTLANNLKAKAEEYLESVVNQHITIELNAIDLHLLDRDIESFRVCDYVHVISKPHNFDAVLLCNKQTIDLLKPENDTVVLGYQTSTFTGSSNAMAESISSQGKVISSIKQKADKIEISVEKLDEDIDSRIEVAIGSIELSVTNGETSSTISIKSGETVISSQNINFSGFVTFEGLEDGTTAINGGCIITDSISADSLHLSGLLSVYAETDEFEWDDEISDFVPVEIVGGYIGYDAGFYGNAAGIGIKSQNEYSQMVCTNVAARLSYTDDGSHITQVVCGQELALSSVGSIQFSIGGDVSTVVASLEDDAFYPYDPFLTLGKPGFHWLDVYAAGTSMGDLLARVQALENA